MRTFLVTRAENKFTIYSEEKVYAEIVFDDNKIEATLLVEDKTLRAVRSETKDMVLKEGTKNLFTFKFDYIWGGAEIVSEGMDTGFDIKGRWFKPGTRLTDNEDKDLVVAVKKGNGLEVSVLDEGVSSTMILATVYYHIYASGGKMLSVLMGVAAG